MWRERASLTVAVAGHSALLVAMWRHQPSTMPIAPVESRVEDTVWDLDVPSEEAPIASEPAPTEEPIAVARPRERQAAPESSEIDGTERGPPPSPSPSAGPSAEGWTFSPSQRKPVDLGLGSARTPRSLVPGGAAKVEAPADERPSTTGGLVEALDAEDSKRGLGRGGPVKLAVEAAASTTDAPMEGTASFDIAVNADGSVHVRLVGASSESEGWSRLTASIQANLARKRVRIPPGSKGLHVVVDIEAHLQFPDGTRPGALGGRVGMTPVGPAASYRGKVCGVGVSLAGISGGCSPENAGMPATRIVSSRITRETRL